MKTIRESIADNGGRLSAKDVGRTLRAYYMTARWAAERSPDGAPETVAPSAATDFIKAGGPDSWRAAAQVVGVLLARSPDNTAELDATLEAAHSHVAPEHWGEFQRVAHDCAVLEALSAWQWLPRESWPTARERFPWLVSAHEWLARRDPDALAELDDYAAYCLGELCGPASHDVLCELLAGIGEIPEIHRDRVARLMREKLADVRAGDATTIDGAFLAVLERIGADGKRLAGIIRKDLPGMLIEYGTASYGWLPSTSPVSPPRRLATLAAALWRDVVEPEVERLERNTAALAYAVHEDVSRIHSRAYELENNAGQRALVFDDRDPIVLTPAMAEDAMGKLVARGVGMLGSVTAHRVLRWEVVSGYERVMRGEADARTLVVDGGWTALAEELGMTKAQVQDLRAIVHAQSAVTIPLSDGSRGNMLAVRDVPSVGRRRGKVEIVLGTMLLPHYTYELSKNQCGRVLRENKRLVPIAALPAFVGRANDHGAQATVSMLVMREFRTRAAEFYREGAIRITLDRWASLFLEAGAPSSILGKALDRWTRDGSDGPAFLSKLDRDAYTLADAYKRERAFLHDAGKREAVGSDAGKAAVRKRAAKRRRAEAG